MGITEQQAALVEVGAVADSTGWQCSSVRTAKDPGTRAEGWHVVVFDSGPWHLHSPRPSGREQDGLASEGVRFCIVGQGSSQLTRVSITLTPVWRSQMVQGHCSCSVGLWIPGPMIKGTDILSW